MFRFVTIIPLEFWAIVLLLLFMWVTFGLWGDGHYGSAFDANCGRWSNFPSPMICAWDKAVQFPDPAMKLC
jgi:hypothetical protein